jgi:hypothetical protein
MLIFMMFLFALLVIVLLIQFNIYSRSSHNVSIAKTSPAEVCVTTLQSPLAAVMQGQS